MENNIELLIGVAITNKEWELHKFELKSSINNLRSVFGEGCIAYVVIQDESFTEQLFYQTEEEWLYISRIKMLGVSNARNMCIEKSIELKTTFLIFHDATIYWSIQASEFIHKYRFCRETPKVNIIFDSPKIVGVESNGSNDIAVVKADPVYNTYVWSYLLRVDNLKDLRFDTNYGPGVNTRYKSGEDVIFLFDYFSENNLVKVSSDKNVAVYHPPRPTDYSKHLLYAYGQGALFRKLIKKHLSTKIIVDCILFFGNAVFRCVLLKKNSLAILLNRLKGFIGV
ncbi:hypothetical protein [Enterobacter sp. P82]|uniref:hypothetical protein n=1 Tax=Enterobacter sp. P82 TaxID=3123033 RepID=UPI00300D4738